MFTESRRIDAGSFQGMNPAFVQKVRRDRRNRKRDHKAEHARREKLRRDRECVVAPEDELPLARAVFRSRFMPAWAFELVQAAAIKHGVSIYDIANSSLNRAVVAAKHEAIYEVKAAKPMKHCTIIGQWFAMNHSSVLYAIAKHARINDRPVLVGFDATAKLSRMSAYMRGGNNACVE